MWRLIDALSSIFHHPYFFPFVFSFYFSGPLYDQLCLYFRDQKSCGLLLDHLSALCSCTFSKFFWRLWRYSTSWSTETSRQFHPMSTLVIIWNLHALQLLPSLLVLRPRSYYVGAASEMSIPPDNPTSCWLNAGFKSIPFHFLCTVWCR